MSSWSWPLPSSPTTLVAAPFGGSYVGYHAALLPHSGDHLEALGVDVDDPVAGEEGRAGTRYITTQV